MELRPPRRDPKQVLILGTGPRVPRVVRELIGFFRRLQITVLADSEQPDIDTVCAHLAEDCHGMLVEMFGKLAQASEDQDAWRIRVEGTMGEEEPVDARVTILAADWTHGHRMKDHGHRMKDRGAVDLEATDVVLLLPSLGPGPDVDGQVALDCLHLAHLERTEAVRFRRDTHILALVRDPEKGDLLERRLSDVVTQGGSCRHTVISQERARHRFITQNVFVRGLNTVYLDLLGSQGPHFARLHPYIEGQPAREGRFDVLRLADHLLHDRGLLLIGWELHGINEGGAEEGAEGDGEAEVVVDPEEWVASPGGELEWASIRALYVLGDPRQAF